MEAREEPVRVGVSACLLGERVRWDGGHKLDRWIARTLGARVVLVPVCPEVEIGLGTPRPPIRLEGDGAGGVRLVEPSTGRDLTRRMETWAAGRLRTLEQAGLDGWVLKARSPSCGIGGVDLFPPRGSRPRRAGRGRFAAALLERLPGLPVADEEGLRDPRGRAEFLARVLEHHGLRTSRESGMNRWLVKSDPGDYSFADLLRDGATAWSGVKNPLAQRHLRGMRAGDAVLVYETGGVKAVVGTATVARDPYPDPQRPALVVVDLRAGKPLGKPVPLAAAKADPGLRDFPLVRMGRLSVMPVTDAQWKRLLAAK
jgi:uncharacterized protein YbbK (DUF523 family)/predicted RNA-binding protein with PUA-like domain